MRSGLLVLCWLLPALLAIPVPAGAGEFDNIARSRFVHCAFYRAQDLDGGTRPGALVEGRANSLTHLQRLAGPRGRTRAIYTGFAGARDVRVIDTGKRLHFIDSMAGLYVITTVDSCIERDPRRGVCLTYGAMQARHFDARVLTDPDGVFEAFRGEAEPGFCDYSFVGLRQTAR